MKYIFLIVLFLFSRQVFAQHLNDKGHFIFNKDSGPFYKVNITPRGSVIEIANLSLKGNSVFETPKGIITLSGDDETVLSYLRLYNLNGTELFSRSFKHIINFSLSPNKDNAAFHDGREIQLIDIAKQTFRSIKGTNVFSVNDAGQLALYDEESSTINFDKVCIKITEPVYKILYFKDTPLFITRGSIIVLEGNTYRTIYSVKEGRLFDAGIFNDRLYVSLKIETPGEFVFNSYTSADLKDFVPEEQTHFLLASKTQNINEQLKINTRGDMPKGELIRTPLNYYSDSVYQQVGNSYDEMQDYGDPYLHPGVDLLGNYLQDVYSVKHGYVKAILTTGGYPYWRIAISNKDIEEPSQGYLYAHLEQTSFPYAVGDSVNEGDVIGLLVNFPVQGFVHCHFARIIDQGVSWKGDWLTFDNPLSFMTNLVDNIPPTFEKTIGNDEFAFRDDNGNYLSPDNLFGKVKVISKVYDRVNSNWHIGVNKLSYNLSPLASPHTLLFDSIAFEYNYFNDYYTGGSNYLDVLNTLFSRDINCFSVGNYDNRDFYNIITNSDGNDTIDVNDANQFFDTQHFADGSYIFRVIASDASSNTTVDSMIIVINNFPTNTNSHSAPSILSVSPNPFSSNLTVAIPKVEEGQFKITVKNLIGQLVYTYKERNLLSSIKKVIDLDFLPNAIYFVEVEINGKRSIQKIIKE